METLLRRAVNYRSVRWMLIGALGGCVAIAVVLVMRGREQPTLVLEVQPLTDPSQIRVYVGGAVVAPGLYTLPRGARVAEAIDAAGGQAHDADTSTLGMAAPLDDADQIIVPTRVIVSTRESAASSFAATQPASHTPDSSDPATPLPPTKININTASASELDALPGIGPTIAARIIDFRTTDGPFQSIDDLELIRGISAAMVEELRPLVTIGP